MSSNTDARVMMDELEVGLYRHGDEIIVYVNQGSVCIFRERIE